MKNEIALLGQIVAVSSAIIEKPNLSLLDFGIDKDIHTKQLSYTKEPSKLAYAAFATTAATSAKYIGTCAIVAPSALSTFGLIAATAVGAGTVASAAGVSSTGIGVVVVPFILGAGYAYYKKRKNEQVEKDRVYKELIKKQQAAINKQKDINRRLEELLRSQDEDIDNLKSEIQKLKLQIIHLSEVIEMLTEQLSNFKDVA